MKTTRLSVLLLFPCKKYKLVNLEMLSCQRGLGQSDSSCLKKKKPFSFPPPFKNMSDTRSPQVSRRAGSLDRGDRNDGGTGSTGRKATLALSCAKHKGVVAPPRGGKVLLKSSGEWRTGGPGTGPLEERHGRGGSSFRGHFWFVQIGD